MLAKTRDKAVQGVRSLGVVIQTCVDLGDHTLSRHTVPIQLNWLSRFPTAFSLPLKKRVTAGPLEFL